jgi:hypothetical protein
MKKILLLTVLLYTFGASSQENKDAYVFSKKNTWLKETLKFPIGFAREIPYEGFADIRFHKDWLQKEKPGFWSYLFAWHVKGDQKLTSMRLESYMKLYYDGLVNANDPNIPASMVLFAESNSSDADYIGKMKIYDRFATKKVITLYVRVKRYFCKKKHMTTIVFRVSPKEFQQEIWKELKEVPLKDSLCAD